MTASTISTATFRVIWAGLVAVCVGILLLTGIGAAVDQGGDAIATALHSTASDVAASPEDCSKEKPDANCLSCAFAQISQAVAPVRDVVIAVTIVALNFPVLIARSPTSAPMHREPDPPRS